MRLKKTVLSCALILSIPVFTAQADEINEPKTKFVCPSVSSPSGYPFAHVKTELVRFDPQREHGHHNTHWGHYNIYCSYQKPDDDMYREGFHMTNVRMSTENSKIGPNWDHSQQVKTCNLNWEWNRNSGPDRLIGIPKFNNPEDCFLYIDHEK